MPRRTAKQKYRQRKTAAAMVGALLFSVFVVVTLTVPGFSGWFRRLTGITPPVAVPSAGVQSAVAVHVIDVGQGDAVLLEADGAFALIDAGPPETAETVVAYLEEAGASRLALLFVTHPHADHIGGMRAVAEALPVDCVVLPDFSLAPYPTTSTFLALLQALEEQGVRAETAAEGQAYALGTGTVTVVHAGLRTEDNYNLLSLGLLFQAGGLRFLNTGDGEAANERAMLESGAGVRADVFLAGHHGSSTSNKAAFIEAVQPDIVVISCAAGNSYGHPHRSALAAYEEAGALVLRTDRQGSVVICPTGDGRLAYGVAKNAE